MTHNDKSSIVERCVSELVKRPENHVTLTDSWAQLVTPGVSDALQNGIFRSVLDEAEVDAKVASAIELYGSLKVPFWWIVTPSTRPANMGSTLLAKGFEHAHTIVGMIADSTEIRVARPEGVTVEVVGEQNLEEWLSVQAAGWSMSPASVELTRRDARRRAQDGDKSKVDLLLRVNGAACGAGSIRFLDGCALLQGGVVLPAFRGRGVFRARVAAALEIISSRNMRYVTAHCIKETSAPIFRRFGFEEVCEIGYYKYG